MSVGAAPFAEAATDRLPDLTEVAVTEVQPQFFKGVLNLDPRMIPGVSTVETAEIGHVLYNLSWMGERERQLMALHREHPTEAMGRGLQLCREMGGVGGQADITDLVSCGHDGQAVVEEHVGPVDGLEVLLPALTVVVEHLEHVAT